MSVLASIEYLSRLDLYQTEKPYMTTFEIPGHVGRTTNHQYTPHEARIQDVRDTKALFSLGVHGFEYRDWPAKLHEVDFDDPASIESCYYPQVLLQMRQAFPDAKEILILSHLVGKCFSWLMRERN